MTAEVPFYWVLVAILATVVFGSFVGSWLRGDRSPLVEDDPDQPPALPEGMPRSLDHPWMQGRVQVLLDKHRIVGSCNVRNGRVMRCPSPGEGNAFAGELHRTVNLAISKGGGNPNLALYTYREDQLIPLGNLTLADLLGLALMLEPES